MRSKRLCLLGKFDLVFTVTQPPVLGGILGTIGKRLTGGKLMYQIMDFNPEQTIAVNYAGNKAVLNAMMWWDKRSCRKSDVVVTLGRDMQKTLINRFNGKDVPNNVVINNWIDETKVFPLPKDFEDYAPHTLYGESKVETERRIKNWDPQYTWSIIRPTSIWGPWFGEPYNRFFHIVLRHMYFHMGKRACRKTYGYVDNAVYQIMSILEADAEKVNRKVFYLGDYEPYDITEWANEIAKEAGIWIPRIPYWCFVCAGWFGDVLKKFGINFPMTSFRLHNMTTDNVHNLKPVRAVAPNLPVTRIEGTKRTLDWINNVEKKA